MLNLLPQPISAEVTERDFEGDGEDIPPQGIRLQKLTPKHRQVLSLMAQGMDRISVGIATDFTPQYVSWLMKQEVCQEYLREIVAVAEAQLQAQFCQAVDVIGDTMRQGTEEGKLKAAKLQLEATGRVGKLQQPTAPPVEGDRLNTLAERLVNLLKQEKGKVVNGEVTDVQIEREDSHGRPRSEGTGELQGPQPRGNQSQHGTVRANGEQPRAPTQ